MLQGLTNMFNSLRARKYRFFSSVGVVVALIGLGCQPDIAAANVPADRFATYANPVDLPYRYQPARLPYREAADPTVIRFKGRYWLFASHSLGYWYSSDLLHWFFVKPTGYDVGRYAPTAVVMNGKVYLTASENAKTIWVSP